MTVARRSSPGRQARQPGVAPKGACTLSPIHRLIGSAGLRCTGCDAPAGTCDCWTPCSCGWSHLTGETCRNPVHPREEAARETAEFIASSVIASMRLLYPEPMRHASGGFAKTLKAHITREAKAMVMEILNTDPREL